MAALLYPTTATTPRGQETTTPATTTTTTAAPTSSTYPPFVRSRFNPRLRQELERQRLEREREQLATAATTTITSTTTSSRATTINIPISVSTTPATTTTTTVKPVPVITVAPTAKPTVRRRWEVLAPTDNDCGSYNQSTPGRFPWVAILEHGLPEKGNRQRTVSKGVLIDRRHVLTTVSSVQHSFPDWILTDIRLGDPAVPRRRGTLGQIRLPIEAVFLHETQDIALIRLLNMLPRNSTRVQPMCVPQEDFPLDGLDLQRHVCEKRGVGGRTEPTASRLLPVDQRITADECKPHYRQYQTTIDNRTFCAWEPTVDTCTGGVGGPIIAKIRHRYHIVGLASYVHTKTEPKGKDMPSIYVRVGAYRHWISAVIQTVIEPPYN
ncbi:melanization protease 1-like isoform X2 [Anopheles aquasalis]|uniref:melanization protease 1-like isoform X2 n=1 Tax=Anopheles aquasalis TaxID=42839 RepID=UPI00215B40F1|nr:melanization protease 1-like isoform X2 [Anopheles aquasalis]